MALLKRKKPQTTNTATSSTPVPKAGTGAVAGKPIPKPAGPPRAAVPVAPPKAVPTAPAAPPRAAAPGQVTPPKAMVPKKLTQKIEPQNRADFKTAEDYWKLFRGRGETDDNPVPLEIFVKHFKPEHGNGNDFPSDVWVQNNYGIIFKYVDIGRGSRTNMVRPLSKPKLDMNYMEDEL